MPVVVPDLPVVVVVPPAPSRPAVDLRDARDKNNERAFNKVEQWVRSTGGGDELVKAYFLRLALALVTESSGGYIYANDGSAYDSSKRTAWNVDDNGNPLPKDLQDKVRDVLRKSLDIPHDKVGSNGRSTGMLQQISLESNQARFAKSNTWGWGSIPETMDPETSALMFVKQLRITNNPVYLTVTTLSPIIADVLRVQQPLASEVAKNYGKSQLDWALALAEKPSTYFSTLKV